MVKFAYTILYVKDVKKSISFYEKAFGMTAKFIAPGDEYGELDTGASTLSFAVVSLANKNLKDGFVESTTKGKPFGIEIGLTTDDVETVYNNAVKAGAIEVEKAITKPWGQTVAYVRDIDGFLIEICTHME
jgi:lactoylglutathione lyase